MSTYEFKIVCESTQTTVVVHKGAERIPKFTSGDIILLDDPQKPENSRLLQCFEDAQNPARCTGCSGYRWTTGGKCVRPLGSKFCLFARRPGLRFKDLTEEMEEI